jgi:hypothetical protein
MLGVETPPPVDKPPEPPVVETMPIWMEMFPTIQIRIQMGRYILGNSSLPSTMVCMCRRANLAVGWQPEMHDP